MPFFRCLLLMCLPLWLSAQENPRPFDLQGHRGARGLMPENTIPAMLKAIDLGVNTLELDVVITGDRQVLVSHESWMNADICLDSNGREMSGSRGRQLNLYRMKYADIITFDCGSKKNSRFPDQEKLPVHKPLLEDLLQVCERYTRERRLSPVRYNIEIKSSPAGDNKEHPVPEEFADLVLQVINKRGLADRVTIQSFDARPLQYLQQRNTPVKLAFLTEEALKPDEMIRQLGFIPDIFSPYFKLVDKALVAECRRLNMQLIPWTVNEPEQLQKMIRLGVDGLITDYPDRARAVLAETTEN